MGFMYPGIVGSFFIFLIFLEWAQSQ